MWLTRLALKNVIGVFMAAMALLLLGAQSIARLPIDLFPNLAVPVLIVGTIYPGASPWRFAMSVEFLARHEVTRTEFRKEGVPEQ